MRKICILFLSLALIVSCSNSDDDNAPFLDASLEGEWVLNDVICFCFFEDDFNFGAHRLTFNTSDSSVTVENGTNGNFIIQEGTYEISENDAILTINNDSDLQYTYQVRGDVLRLNFVDEPNIADDEITFVYSRNGIGETIQ